MKKNLFLMLAIALGLGLMACNNQSAEPIAEPEVPETPEAPEWKCDEPYCQYESTGTDLWPSLRTDTAIRNRLVGKWQQIAWSSYEEDEKMHYEESENTIEFTLDGEWIGAKPATFVKVYHIDSDYLYRTAIIEGQPLINGDVFWYAYQFSGSGNELAIRHCWGIIPYVMNYPVNFIYKRMN
ncbi:MAG: hypothetical protein LBL13_11520 [Bacteroidales bacterium]|jgi:hypothetical protein|nr:hypothetical protein [Bacteroidales bacterium]